MRVTCTRGTTTKLRENNSFNKTPISRDAYGGHFSGIHISKGSVATRLRRVERLNTILLQIYYRVRQ